MSDSAPIVDNAILQVRDLKKHFPVRRGLLQRQIGWVKAVDGVSFTLEQGKILGLVGESGCGKSMTALSIMQLIPVPPGNISGGQILLNDTDLLQLSESRMQDIRGNDISMIFQEPMTSLNPVYTTGYQVMEAILLHKKISKEEKYKSYRRCC